jgi:anaerobic magnesium-protoporphyrin IX monomethyl ester cyclase
VCKEFEVESWPTWKNMTLNIVLCNFTEERNISRGVGYLAACIRADGHSLRYFELPPSEDYESYATQSVIAECDLLLVSSNSIQIHLAQRFMRQCKRLVPSIPIVIGGVHATITGPSILQQCPEADFACIGEGERMIVEFLRQIHTGDFSTIENLAYRKDGAVSFNAIGKPQDLSQLPDFPWRLFPADSVVQSRSRFTYVHATRGCPYNCAYCCNSLYRKLYGRDYLRVRPIAAIVEELRYLKHEYRPGLFYFGDESILHEADYASNLFQALRDNVDMPYGLMARPQQLSHAVIRMLKDTGCRYVAIGVECGDETFRIRHLNRPETNSQIADIFALLRRNDIYTASFNMIGYPFPFDDRLTACTVEFNKLINPNYAMVSVFYPFPGTDLGEYCVAQDMIDPLKVSHTYHYYSDSVLRGYRLAEVREAILKTLNPTRWRDGIYK